MITDELVIEQTKKWINEVVVGCNFCPFASSVIKKNSVRYQVENSLSGKICLESFATEIAWLDEDITTETTFLIFPNSYNNLNDYLKMVNQAENYLKHKRYEGVYQIASFHPQYHFAKSPENDAANYTNRSMYPMLHLLRESSIAKALENYSNPELIPGRNINFAREKGLAYMKMLRDACV